MLGLPHMRTDAAKADSSPVVAEPPSTSNFAMDTREGRVGNAFACERCRKHKVRCVPSDTASLCQRCQKARVECIEHVARRRPAKSRGDGHRSDSHTPNRTREFDKKLDKLSAIVASMEPSGSPSSLPLIATLPSQRSDGSQHTPTPAPAPAPAATQLAPAPTVLKTPILPAPDLSSADCLSFWDSINDTMACVGRLDPLIRSIGLGHMQMLLEIYRVMVDSFPFVPLPKDFSCQDLIRQRPMLMFAVLTVSSYDSVRLQMTLSRELRKVFMVKVMSGSKSLDLLQGLLVFIAWHHHYMEVQSISIPMLLQICLGMTHDLGLEKEANAIRSPLHKNNSRDREMKRTYLGCYFLVSNIGTMNSANPRPSSFPSTLRAYASEIASAWEYKSDVVLPILIDICQYMEDVEETLRDQPEQALIARSQVKRLRDKWESIQAASKLQAKDFKSLQWLLHAAQMRLYRRASSLELADRETPWVNGFRLSSQVNCLRSIETFLDNSTRLSTSQYESVSIVDWLNLASAMTNLSQLALQTPPLPGWDPAELQIANTFEYFRDQLCSRIPHPRDASDTNHDIFERFRRTTALMKTVLRDPSGRASPNSSTFELATGSGRTVSLLQDLPSLKPDGVANGTERLPSLRHINSSFDISKSDFHWRFLMDAN
ncbi:hypothetical protein LEMA_P057170.1 [Plenodomus lingam JN3]|uniref:Zn(2)-C6 fungal-type domain-containing protein n=1 Tax=Leptosphaeria maculans (strain JN3 / isolate v23.1.3 / race Av1-4-5-6-7-8) TaxID=985895 RepID=E4ZHB3_LEPMJ|nr:hypothetical protein LEMA_P057170.1 [Plenodomus lingam JN3]CBX90683.1 hypothetical protein LEMA_P057170.1 [Plenodomus lingam JN3]